MNAQAPAPPLYETISPTLKWLLTVCIMMATIMQALDTTIANVALPYMQGSLATTQDQINWVLTSYIVAAAIMTSPLGWMATRFGRKKLFIVCTAGFTVASMLCGVALSIEQMVAYRLLQGVFGAALVPLSQAVMLDIFPPAKRGSAMAIWGMGVMLGPIMGPTLGGWLTDSYSWRWVFFVNLPFGILTTVGPLDLHERDADAARRALLLVRLLEPVARHRLVANDARPRRAARLVRVAGDHHRGGPVRRRLLFLPRRLPYVRSGRSSASASSATGISPSRSSSCSWSASSCWRRMALVTPFIQNLLNYPVLSSGFLLGTRGIGTFVAMFLVGQAQRQGRCPDPHLHRPRAGGGVALPDGRLVARRLRPQTIAINSIAQGFGLGFIFVPLNTIAFASLPGELRTEGAALWTLIRNIGSSVGISVVIARLTSMTTMFHSQLVEHATPFNDALRMPNASMVWGHGLPEHGDARRDHYPAGGGDGLFERFPVHDASSRSAPSRCLRSSARQSLPRRRLRAKKQRRMR